MATPVTQCCRVAGRPKGALPQNPQHSAEDPTADVSGWKTFPDSRSLGCCSAVFHPNKLLVKLMTKGAGIHFWLYFRHVRAARMREPFRGVKEVWQ